MPQTVITFGGVGLKRNDPDFIPAYVLNHILGGGSFSSRLYTKVREKRGLAYSVYSYLAPLDHAGLFLGGTRRATTVRLRRSRSSSRKSGVLPPRGRQRRSCPGEELPDGSYVLHFDTSGKIAGQLLEIQLENLGIDYIDRRNGLIKAVTAEDVRRAAKRFLADSKLLVMLVGGQAFSRPAVKAGSRRPRRCYKSAVGREGCVMRNPRHGGYCHRGWASPCCSRASVGGMRTIESVVGPIGNIPSTPAPPEQQATGQISDGERRTPDDDGPTRSADIDCPRHGPNGRRRLANSRNRPQQYALPGILGQIARECACSARP